MATTMYGTAWCSDCKRAKQFFGEQRVTYDFVDVDQDPAGRAVVQGHNGGKDIIPTIVFDDGSVLVEPRGEQHGERAVRTTVAGRDGAIRTVHPDLVHLLGREDLDTEAQRLPAQPVGELLARHAFGEPREVVQELGDSRLSAHACALHDEDR